MKTTPRLHLDSPLAPGAELALSREQGHYLTSVLRLVAGDPVRVFNNADGEYLAYLGEASKKTVRVRCERLLADVALPPDIDCLFAPLKHARLDYLVQKMVELGARRLRPVITARTIVDRVNMERMRANVIEAAEQCNTLHVPDVSQPEKLERVLASWEPSRPLIFCDEAGGGENPVEILKPLHTPLALLVGPEGGFTGEERELLRSYDFVVPISLGPRIMRADTAGVAALSLIQALCGDWGLAGKAARP